MYEVFIDGYASYDPACGLPLGSPSLKLELNKVGSFKFSVHPGHPMYDRLRRLRSIVEVYDSTQLVFRGRVLNVSEGFYGAREVDCEGELAFLLDSVQRPWDFQGDVPELFAMLVEAHNAQVDNWKRFEVGRVTVTDPNGYVHYSDSTYLNTWDTLNDKLLKRLGGYLFVRNEGGVRYLDYVADFDLLSTQPVEFGSNLLDFEKASYADEVFTAVVPLGARDQESDKRLTVESVNGGLDYIQHDEAVAAFGFIAKAVSWDDVTEASNLLRKGTQWLADAINETTTWHIYAADLSGAGHDVGSFHLGTYIKADSAPHGVDNANFLVKALNIPLDKPDGVELAVGATVRSFTEQRLEDLGSTAERFESVREEINDVVVSIDSVVSSQVSQEGDRIYQRVAEDFYTKDEAAELVGTINTQFEQTKSEFTFTFTEFQQDVDQVLQGQDAKFEEWKKYIRFVGGDILLGEEGNQLTLRIENDRISFREGNYEVAYFSDQKLYVTDGEFLHSLQLGKFAFLPRANGNLSFKKVVD